MSEQNIAIFGSAFNPPHRGHEDVIQQAFTQFNNIILVPSFRHAFGKTMMDYDLRINMVEALISELQTRLPDNKMLTLSSAEKTLAASKNDNEPIYTYDVLDYFSKKLNTDNLSFIVGPDNAQAETWAKFYKAEEILARWNIWPAEERIPLRSTMIRKKLARGIKPNTDECCLSVSELLMHSLNHDISN